jgi:hypothetical protein
VLQELDDQDVEDHELEGHGASVQSRECRSCHPIARLVAAGGALHTTPRPATRAA